MTPAELLKENAALREQLASAVARANEAVDLAVETSVAYDEATNLVTALTGAAIAQKDGTPPAKPAPAPPPSPVPPPPIAPASFGEFLSLPSAEKAKLRAHFGDDLEERLHAEKMNAIRLGNASRGGFSGGIATIGEQLGGPHVFTAKERAAADVAAYNIGEPRPLPHGTFDPVKANIDALNRGLGWGAPKPAAKAAAPKPAPAPSGTAQPGQKSRHVAGGGGFAVRSK
jgi:hypothetical protein